MKLRDRGLAKLLGKEKDVGDMNRRAAGMNINSSPSEQVSNNIIHLAKYEGEEVAGKGKDGKNRQIHDNIVHLAHSDKKLAQLGGHSGRSYTLAQALEFIDKSTPEWLPAAMDTQPPAW